MDTLYGKRVGFAICGSHCSYEEVFPHVEQMVKEGAVVYPILSQAAATVTTRFGTGSARLADLEDITGNKPLTDLVDVEPMGPKKLLDVTVISPCTGNTLAKFANALTDTPVLMAAKSTLRGRKPVVIAISTNDALAGNAKNIGMLLDKRNVYFVPFGQDNPEQKPTSCVAEFELIVPAVKAALEGRQVQPLLIDRLKRAVK